MRVQSLAKPLAAALALTASLGISAQAAEMGRTGEPIKLAMNEWTGQHITTKVAGEILQRMGYEVEYVTAGYYPQMTAIQDRNGQKVENTEAEADCPEEKKEM